MQSVQFYNIKKANRFQQFILNLAVFFVLLLVSQCTIAQPSNCIIKDTAVYIDFGSSTTANNALGKIVNYRIAIKNCPDDGFVSFANRTSNCFSGKWITVTEDHSPGDRNGNMMIVNALLSPSMFFRFTINNLEPGTTYQFSTWVMNIFKSADGCIPTHPNLFFLVQNAQAKQIAKFSSGTIPPVYMPVWQNINFSFTTPANETTVIITIADITTGGCGNDFVMDDITVCRCITQKIEVPVKTKQDVIKEPVKKPDTTVSKVNKQVGNKMVDNQAMLPKPSPVAISGQSSAVKTTRKPIAADTQRNSMPIIKILTARENPVVQKIETTTAELQVALYDNGEIDGDTVSVYHNNILVVDRQRLSTIPILIKIPVDETHPHHELIIVANNLGSIPPNTSLMVVAVNGKRYETFISTNEQKNAKLIVDWKRQ